MGPRLLELLLDKKEVGTGEGEVSCHWKWQGSADTWEDEGAYLCVESRISLQAGRLWIIGRRSHSSASKSQITRTNKSRWGLKANKGFSERASVDDGAFEATNFAVKIK